MQSVPKFADVRLKQEYLDLDEGDKSRRDLHKWLTDAFNALRTDVFAGIRMQKRLIPKKYRVTNLWKYNLPDGWRLLYTIKNDEAIIVSIILEWLPHKEYERRFKY